MTKMNADKFIFFALPPFFLPHKYVNNYSNIGNKYHNNVVCFTYKL